MLDDSRYIFEVLRAEADLTLYRMHRPDVSSVLALTTTERRPRPDCVARLQHEYDLAPALDSTWAARPIELSVHDAGPVLLLEDAGGWTLQRAIEARNGRPLELGSFLQLASELAGALTQAHKSSLIHRDIRPANVLVDDAGRVRLTGFGIAARLRAEPAGPTEWIAGSFAYMAPEQTGRMHRSIDARSDLYALGVSLYQLLTGTLPFTTSDPVELVHCHLARQALAPSEQAPGVPQVIDQIVLKLLAKNPDDRYGSAAHLEADLRACLEAVRAGTALNERVIAPRAASGRLAYPTKLYGRDAALATLHAAFERVASTGSTELVLVSGYAGIGKSALVAELQRALPPACAMFAAGKFEQYKPDIPYATLAQAFQSLVRQLLGKSDAELLSWRDELARALGPYGQLMVNLIPALALVIGVQPPVPPVEPHAAQGRFQLVFRSLLRTFAKQGRPLVLFIDDLQWLDSGTLHLVEHLLSDPDVRHVLLIGAYRDSEVSESHPLTHMLAALSGQGRAATQIALEPLSAAELARLCADVLHTEPQRALPLAELLAEKTGGNPFFAVEFVAALHDEKLIVFDEASARWRWDVARIRAKGITDNVAQLLSAKLGRLPEATREALAQLACLGTAADLQTLVLLCGCDELTLQRRLQDAVSAGFIVPHSPRSTGFAFTHDRVQEAAYASIAAHERAAVHLRIARALRAATPADELDDRIFDLVHQYDRGASELCDSAERSAVAQLFLLAGKRAKLSSAYASALAYLREGRALLGDDGWSAHYALTFELELHRAECEIVLGEMSEAEARLAQLALHALSLSEQSAVVCLAVLLCFSTGRSERAVEVALEFLARMGIAWSKQPSKLEVEGEYQALQHNLVGHDMASLSALPAMSDPTCIATMAVLTELFPAAYAVDRYLLELVLLRMTNLSLQHGNAESSSVAYSALNMALGGHFADYATAFRFGQLACELVEQRGADRYKARVYSCFAAFTMPWSQRLALCRPLMTQAFEIGSSMGDMAFAAYNSRNMITHSLFSGLPLEQVQREAEQVWAFASKIQLGLPVEWFIRQLELVQKLRGVIPSDQGLDEAWARQDIGLPPQLAMMVCYHWVFKLQERYFAGDLEAALAAVARIRGLRWAMRSSLEEAEYELFAALSCAAVSTCGASYTGSKAALTIAKHYERICLWAESCPENFANRKALVGAEIARLEGRWDDAQREYEQAIQLAHKHGFAQNEGLASELAGKFYAARGLTLAADAYLTNARACYERWGAVSKVKQLDARYPRLRGRTAVGSVSTRVETPIAQLDVSTVDKASQTLSSEMVLPSLLEKLMRLAVEHAGAERGLFIRLRDSELFVEAEASTGVGNVAVSVRTRPVTEADLARSVVQYVLRTRDRVVLDDASIESIDVHDAYVRERRPKSVLCLPVVKQDQVVGALYLENNLTTCAFTADRVAVLDFLTSHAAIALDNARLYSDLQRSEALLNEAQHLSSTGSFSWRVAGDTLEFSEQTYRMYGLDPEAPVTLELIASRTHPEDLPLWQELIAVARGPASDLDYVYRALLPDLSVRHLHLVAHGARDADGQLEYIGAIQDVTQRYAAEEALSKVRSELAHVTRLTTLGALTASIAHEVSQPLAGIVTNSSTCLRMLAAEPPNVAGARETVRRTLRDGHRAADVITRLRALFGNKGVTNERVDLNETAREVITLSFNELQSSRVALRTELAPDLPAVSGDRVQLQQVILNLLLNASDAMRGIDSHKRTLSIKTQLDQDGRVRLSVQDRGVGFAAADVDKLFDAFYTTKSGGMGMGLSVSRSIVESHQGRLWAELNDGPGATFTFSLPAASDAVIVSYPEAVV